MGARGDKWRLDLREDQVRFVVSALEYVQARADAQVDDSASQPFRRFSAIRTKERATEIIEYLTEVTT